MEESFELEQTSPVSDGVKTGVIIGFINIVISVLLYVIDPTMMGSLGVSLGILVLNLVLLIVMGIKYRKSVGGYLSYGKAFTHGFVTLLVSGLIGVIFSILLFTVIDPDLPALIIENTIERTSEMMVKFGAPESSIDEAIAQMEKDMPPKFTAGGQLIQFAWSIIVFGIVALLSALIVKKNEPIENF